MLVRFSNCDVHSGVFQVNFYSFKAGCWKVGSYMCGHIYTHIQTYIALMCIHVYTDVCVCARTSTHVHVCCIYSFTLICKTLNKKKKKKANRCGTIY